MAIKNLYSINQDSRIQTNAQKINKLTLIDFGITQGCDLYKEAFSRTAID